MPHDLAVLPVTGTLTTEQAVQDRATADAFRQASKADTTIRAYRSDLRAFEDWCRSRGPQSCPASPDTVADHLAWCATTGRLSPSSIGRRTAAIRYGHKLAGFDPPTSSETVRAAIAGIRRTMGVAPRRKQPVTAERLTDMLKGLPDTLAGKRDRALLCLGLAGAFRRSELVALTVADLVEVPDGYRVLIRRSKTDQSGEGQEIAIPRGFRLRPVEAVQTWLEAAQITEGPIFRRITTRRLDGRGKPATELVGADALTGHTVAAIVKGACQRAGLDPKEFSGHSLRSGFVTSAVEMNAPILKIVETTRHRSVDMLRVYSRRADLFREHAGAAFL
jgi:site-specific recombinase XerD